MTKTRTDTTNTTKDAIKDELLRRRLSLTSAIQSNRQVTRDTAEAQQEAAKDPYGGASATHDSEVAVAVAERLARQLAQVDRALVDFEAGRYGICQDCDEPIAPARLKVLPFTTRCVSCQASVESAKAA
jgi:RNA polymerase-binding transcription factor